MVNAVVDAIVEKSHTGNNGDSKVFISDVQDAIRIKTRDCGTSAA